MKDNPQNRRRPPELVTPGYEDAGLFKKGINQLPVELVPRFAESSRGDLVIRGFMRQGEALDVIFPGRRAKDAAPLERQLRRMLQQARQSAAAAGAEPPSPDSLRLAVQLEGAWRTRFQQDISGWDTRSFQYLVARWAYFDEAGNPARHGSPPVMVPNRQPGSR